MKTIIVRRGLSVAVVALLALLAGACATSPTGRSQLLLVPPIMAIEASAAAYVDTEVFSKKTGKTPKTVIETCKARLREYDHG